MSEKEGMNLPSSGTFNVKVRPKEKKADIVGYDRARKAYIISVTSPPDKGRANDELLRFISKKIKKRVVIIRGSSSRLKLLKIIET